MSVRPAACEYLFNNGSLEDAMAVFNGFDAAMDAPFMLMYEEVLANFPKSKFILTLRDPERWYESEIEMVNEIKSDEKLWPQDLYEMSNSLFLFLGLALTSRLRRAGSSLAVP